MKSVAKTPSLLFLVSIFIIGLSLYIFPCITCHDDCCDDSLACDALSCQCSCGVSGMAVEKFQPEHSLGPISRHKPGYSTHKAYDISAEFYRPPEFQVL